MIRIYNVYDNSTAIITVLTYMTALIYIFKIEYSFYFIKDIEELRKKKLYLYYLHIAV